MANDIVTLNVTQTVAPTPSTLQRTGAFISQGGTTLTAGATALLTELSDFTAIMADTGAITAMTWATEEVTVQTAAAHGITVGDTCSVTIAGATPTGYNGTFTVTSTGKNTFTFPLATSPGTVTTEGTWIPASANEVLTMATTFFSQGTAVGCYVLELGPGSAAVGVTALHTWITANPKTIYAYLVPREWDAVASFITMLGQYEATTAMTYFFVTTTISTYTNYLAAMKDVYAGVEAPAVVADPTSEFSLASDFYQWIMNKPSSTNMVCPMAFREVTDVTAYPTKGNSALFATLKAAGINWHGTGAEGGISNTIIFWGRTCDSRPATYWYSVDWVQINLKLDLANAIINGSNDPQAPLYYNQHGINQLQAVAQSTMNRGITYGLVLSPVTVSAIDFATYCSENPSDYKEGVYDGLSTTYTPSRGFESITFNVDVTDFVAS